jgi:hypothetical protein
MRCHQSDTTSAPGFVGGFSSATLWQWLKYLPRLGTPIVLNAADRGNDRRYSYSYARRIVREARRKVELPEHVTLDACRHAGLT